MENPSNVLSPAAACRFYPLGDAALVVEFGEVIDPGILARVQALARQLTQHPLEGMVELVPAFTTLTVYYHPLKVKGADDSPFQNVKAWVEKLIAKTALLPGSDSSEVKRIPVCYGGVFGPDLEFVAQNAKLSPQEVISRHAGGQYQVYMIGFAPGFPYLGGLDTRLAAPRKNTPRAAIPTGSVGIAGGQTGVYPLETPGGWQLIGRTPVPLFRPFSASPSWLQAGDRVQFYPITAQEFHDWKKEKEVHGH